MIRYDPAMSQKKPSLGRGLEALLGSIPPPRPPSLVPTQGALPQSSPAGAATALAAAGAPQPKQPARDGDLARLPLDSLQRGRYQPRVDMRPESLDELASSIRAQGVIQPVVVRPLEMPGAPATAPLRYEIIAGERRWRAARIAGLKEIPAIIRRVADDAAIAMALIENIQRENLNPLEEARALDRLIREFGLTHQQAADSVGRSRATVSNLLRLLELAPEVAERLEQRELEMGHARALLGLATRGQQAEAAATVVQQSLSVRGTEALVRQMLQPASRRSAAPATASAGAAPDANVAELERDLSERLGARVEVHSAAAGKGRLIIHYHSLDELDGILAHVK